MACLRSTAPAGPVADLLQELRRHRNVDAESGDHVTAPLGLGREFDENPRRVCGGPRRGRSAISGRCRCPPRCLSTRRTATPTARPQRREFGRCLAKAPSRREAQSHAERRMPASGRAGRVPRSGIRRCRRRVRPVRAPVSRADGGLVDSSSVNTSSRVPGRVFAYSLRAVRSSRSMAWLSRYPEPGARSTASPHCLDLADLLPHRRCAKRRSAVRGSRRRCGRPSASRCNRALASICCYLRRRSGRPTIAFCAVEHAAGYCSCACR